MFCPLFYCLTSILTALTSALQPPLHLTHFFYDTHTHPLSFFSLPMFSFSCCSFSSISLLSWAKVTVSICSCCRFLRKHIHTLIYLQSTNNNQSITYSVRLAGPSFHKFVQFICCNGRSLLLELINTVIN